MRLAFGEAWGNALSAMVLDGDVYIDSNGTAQSRGFGIDLELNNIPDLVGAPRGWYNEASVQSILFDIFDATPDGADQMNFGFGPIYDTLVSQEYLSSPLFSSVHLFADVFKTRNPSGVAGLDALLTDQNITVDDAFGSTETNFAGSTVISPIYTTASVDETVQVCVIDAFGPDNRLGNRRYVYFPNTAPGTYNLQVARASGASNTDPDIFLYDSGTILVVAQSSAPDVENSNSFSLNSGDYIAEVFDFNNNNVCYSVTLSSN
jgi:hypothetical protein